MQRLKSKDKSMIIGEYPWYHYGFICINCISSIIPLHLIQYILASLYIIYSIVLYIISLFLHYLYSFIRAFCIIIIISQSTLISCCSILICPYNISAYFCSISIYPYIYLITAGTYQDIPIFN